MRRAVALVIVVGGSLIAAAPASATVTLGTAGVPPTQISLDGDAEADSIHLVCDAGGMAESDNDSGGPTIDLMPCADVEDLFVNGGDNADTIDLDNITAADFPKLRRVLIDGENGTDVVLGTQVGDTIDGNIGDDPVTANGGNDDIFRGSPVNAGEGDDLIRGGPPGLISGGPGNDRFEQSFGTSPDGGPGTDTITLDFGSAPVPPTTDIRLALSDTQLGIEVVGSPPAAIPWSGFELFEGKLANGGLQTVNSTAFSGAVDIDGRGGTDTLLAGPGEDFLNGGPGDDVLNGGLGFDYVQGGDNADQLLLRDGGIDRGLCGTGVDSATADAGDAIASDCETISLPAVAPPPPPATTPTKKKKCKKKKKAAAAKKKCPKKKR